MGRHTDDSCHIVPPISLLSNKWHTDGVDSYQMIGSQFCLLRVYHGFFGPTINTFFWLLLHLVEQIDSRGWWLSSHVLSRPKDFLRDLEYPMQRGPCFPLNPAGHVLRSGISGASQCVNQTSTMRLRWKRGAMDAPSQQSVCYSPWSLPNHIPEVPSLLSKSPSGRMNVPYLELDTLSSRLVASLLSSLKSLVPLL